MRVYIRHDWEKNVTRKDILTSSKQCRSGYFINIFQNDNYILHSLFQHSSTSSRNVGYNTKDLTRLLAAQVADQYTGDRLNSKCLVGQAQRLL